MSTFFDIFGLLQLCMLNASARECCDLLSVAQRNTNTNKINLSMSNFFDIFGLLQQACPHFQLLRCCDLLSVAQRNTNTNKINPSMSNFFDIFGHLQLTHVYDTFQPVVICFLKHSKTRIPIKSIYP